MLFYAMGDFERNNSQIISYLLLRTLIGGILIVLPIILIISSYFFGESIIIQDSISDYYFTKSRDIFVGLLFVLAFFLWTYKGYGTIDNIISNIGFFATLGIALFPNNTKDSDIFIFHFISAGLLFFVFIYFSLVLFRKGVKDLEQTRRKKIRNIIYIVCGIIMIVSLFGIVLSLTIFTKEERDIYKPVFWLESTILWAFGISWLTKGKLFWRVYKRTINE